MTSKGQAVQNWEYVVVEWRGATERIEELRMDGEAVDDWENQSLPELLKQFGDNGWELASVYPGGSFVRMIFKRAKG
ncbi:MAG TPA: hypothetical protein VHL09_01680 [Dehalococcoidia bacterium]|nr:hypothetical protein [Dehalococcoidia bacterium]